MFISGQIFLETSILLIAPQKNKLVGLLASPQAISVKNILVGLLASSDAFSGKNKLAGLLSSPRLFLGRMS